MILRGLRAFVVSERGNLFDQPGSPHADYSRRIGMLAVVLTTLSVGGCSQASGSNSDERIAAISDTLRFGRFGPVVLYRQQAHPGRVVLLVSGDDGWKQGVVAVARDIAGMGALVVGIDLHRYLTILRRAHERCSYPAADFEALSQSLQRRLGFPQYLSPILLGYSSGAALVDATLAQAPPGTFAGAIDVGFQPRLSVKPTYCSGSAHETGHPGAPLMVAGPSAGQLRDALSRLDLASPASPSVPAAAVRDLPVVELPAARPSTTLAIVVSGDGGWANLDRQIGETLSQEGVSVVGFNSLKYFWRVRTPDGAAADLTRILRHYMTAWSVSRVLLVGYSRGADVLPFMTSRLPADLRDKIRLVALLGLSPRAGFELHLTDFLGGSGGLPTLPEIRKLRGMHVLCVYGSEETDTACRDLSPDLVTRMSLPGGHHFSGAYREIARGILRQSSSSPGRS
jgi:type IV secretory pathway VirJ component